MPYPRREPYHTRLTVDDVLTGNCVFQACLLPISTTVPDPTARMYGRNAFVTLITEKKFAENAF